jgi:ribosomal-protein-alanine N-acetyltransferase
MLIEEIKTERLRLRKLTPEVYRYIYAHYSDAELTEFLKLKSAEDLNTEKEKYRLGLSTHYISFVNFQLLDRHTGAHLGGCGFHTWYPRHRRAEIGYNLLSESQMRQGLMSEAVKVILNYGFETMNLNRVEACIGKNNAASISLVKKFGFIQEGNLREHYNKDGELQDSLIFSLLKNEYEASSLHPPPFGHPLQEGGIQLPPS